MGKALGEKIKIPGMGISGDKPANSKGKASPKAISHSGISVISLAPRLTNVHCLPSSASGNL